MKRPLIALLLLLLAPALAHADSYMGDYPVNGLIDCKWNTNDQTGASITRSTDGTLKIYKNNSATERTSLAGVTQTEDFDAATGVHHIRIDTSDNTDAGFYAAGNEYFATMTAMTIDTKTVNAQICSFSIERSGGALALVKARLPNAAAGANGGLPTVDANNAVKVQSGTGANQISLSSGRVDLGNWLGSAPNALVSGRVDALGVIRSATAQAGGASTITLDASASATNNLYNNELVWILSGTGAGQVNTVSSYVGSTKVATMIAAWATNPDSTSVFAITPAGPVSATVGGSVTVGGYAGGQSPADLVLVTPANKLATDASNRVQVQVGTAAGQLSTSSGAVIVQTGTGTGQLDLASGRVRDDKMFVDFDVRKKGATSLRVQLFIPDQRTGKGLTGLVFNAAGLACYYWRDDQGNVGSTQITLAAGTRGSYTSGGFVEKDATNQPGEYELGVPDAAIATGGSSMVLSCAGATNMAPTRKLIALVDATMADIAGAAILRTAIAQGGAAGTITLDALAPGGTDYFKDNNVVISAGAGAGQSRLITAYNGSTKVATVTPSWVTAPDASSVFTVVPPGQVATSVSTNVTVGGYAAGQDPATYVLVTPANKIGTDASNAIKVQSGTGANQLNLSSGRVGINWADVLNPTSTLGLTNTTVGTTTTATNLTNAPTSGDLTATMKTSVENTIWNAARSSHTAAGTFGQGVLVFDKTGFSLTQAFPTNFSLLAITGAGAVTAGTVSDKTGYSLTQAFPTNFSSLAITGGGAVTAGTVSDKTGYTLTSGEQDAIVDKVWDDPTSQHTTTGTTGKALTDAQSAGNPWTTALPGAFTAGQAGFIVGNMQNKIWDEAIAGHLTAGTVGAKLNSAASAGDPWGATLPGAYGAGTAGKIVGDNLNATVSSRMATFTLPSNFSLLSIDANGLVDEKQSSADKVWASATRSLTAAVSVGTNADKTGYSLTQSFPPNFASAIISSDGRITPGSVYRKNVAGQRAFPIELKSAVDGITPRTGLGSAVTVLVYKDGATTPTTATGVVTEATGGLYWFAPSQADTNCQACVFHASGTGARGYVYYFTTSD